MPSFPDSVPAAVGVDLRTAWPARAVAAATVAYSVAITIAPRLLAKPAGLTSLDGSVPASTAALIRSIGVRDAALAAALFVAPAGRTMRVLTAARVASDAADAVWFSAVAGNRTRALKVGGAAAGWALLEAAVGFRRAAAV